MRKLIAILAIVAASTIMLMGATPSWEEVTAPVPAVTHTFDPEAEVEVAVRDGYIYLRTEKAVTVKVFSILGQLISQETVKPGLSRIKMSARGIYILRVGTLTRRITI